MTVQEHNRLLDYQRIQIERGPNLHLISHKSCLPEEISISMTVGFGGVHLSSMDEMGHIYYYPQGMAHFMEHFLFWASFHKQIEFISRKYGIDINGVVIPDCTVWYAKGAMLSSGTQYNKIEAVCEILHSLLALLTTDMDEIDDQLIASTVTDIRNERNERHSNWSYVMQLRLLDALFSNNPIRYDMLGTYQSLSEIKVEHIKSALHCMRSNVSSVTLLGHSFTNELIEKTKQILIQFSSTVTSELKPLSLHSKSPTTKKSFVGLRANIQGNDAFVKLGIKLLPLRCAFPTTDEFLRMYLLNILLATKRDNIPRQFGNHLGIINRIQSTKTSSKGVLRSSVSSLISHTARVYFIGGHINDNWFFLDPHNLKEVTQSLKERFVYSLEKIITDVELNIEGLGDLIPNHYQIEDQFQLQINNAYNNIISNHYAVMKLCNQADLFGYTLYDMLNAFGVLSRTDVNILIMELKHSQENMALACTTRDFIDLF